MWRLFYSPNLSTPYVETVSFWTLDRTVDKGFSGMLNVQAVVKYLKALG